MTGRPMHFEVTDLHVGVVSTDMGTGGYTVETCADPIDGDDGILRHHPNPMIEACDPAYPEYLSYSSPEPDAGQIEWLSTGFGCISILGTSGCGFEQQLKASRRALVDHTTVTGGPNAGFLRPDSLLVIVFVTDEEDCSVADPTIFDTADPTLGHLGLRCYLHPYMIQQVDDYVNAFRALRPPEKSLLGFLVGVPPEPSCEGRGDAIADCLATTAMMEEIDPVDPTRLRYACSSPTGNAFPGRRFVQIAQEFGSRAIVRSICTNDFEPFVDALASSLEESVDASAPVVGLDVSADPLDPCRCEAACTMIETLVDNRPCPDGKPCHEPAGPGTGCATLEDDDGMMHSLCVIPQAGSRMKGCDPAAPGDCGSSLSVHLEDGVGWYYVPAGDPGPHLAYSEGMRPSEGSTTYLSCCP